MMYTVICGAIFSQFYCDHCLGFAALKIIWINYDESSLFARTAGFVCCLWQKIPGIRELAHTRIHWKEDYSGCTCSWSVSLSITSSSSRGNPRNIGPFRFSTPQRLCTRHKLRCAVIIYLHFTTLAPFLDNLYQLRRRSYTWITFLLSG